MLMPSSDPIIKPQNPYTAPESVRKGEYEPERTENKREKQRTEETL